MLKGRMWIFMVKRGNYRGIDLYKYCIYEIDENVGNVFIKNGDAVPVEVAFDTKWTLKLSPKEYLKENPTGPKAMRAKQLMAVKRGVVMLPSNYKEKPPAPIILDETPHQEREKAEAPVEEPVDDAVSE